MKLRVGMGTREKSAVSEGKMSNVPMRICLLCGVRGGLHAC